MVPFKTLLPLFTQVSQRHGHVSYLGATLSNAFHRKNLETELSGVSNSPAHDLKKSKESSALGQQELQTSDGFHNEKYTSIQQNHSQPPKVKDDLFHKVTKSIDVSGLKPKLPSKSYTVVPYVNDSESLTRLIEMGVNITKTEQDAELGNYLLRTDFKRDIQPIILFLMRDIGLSEQSVVKVLSSNLGLLKEHLDDLSARVNFLRYMKFTNEAILTIVTRNPNFLSYPTKDVDRTCGFVQQLLMLTGNETRALLVAYPSKKLIYGDFTRIQAIVDMFQDVEGFSKREVKRMCLKYPRILTYGHSQIARGVDYVMDEMKMSQAELIACPYVFNPKGLTTVKTRHKYIKFLNRDQFNPKKPNYVSLESLLSMDDDEFCEKIAKTPTEDFYDFEKTL